MKKNLEKKSSKKSYILLALIILGMILLSKIIPEKSLIIRKTSFDYFRQVIVVFPAIFILMGLFSVWVPKEIVRKFLGKSSGIKGIFVALLLGSISIGPIFVAFPVAQTLHKKGACYSNIVIFLSAWACIKIPQELMELQFLGAKFMIARLILSIFLIIAIGLGIDKLMSLKKTKKRS